MRESGSTDPSLVPPGCTMYMTKFGHWFLGSRLGCNCGISLGFAALSLRLTGGSFACQVHSIQQHQEEEVGHGVVLEHKLTLFF